jgi:1-phosphatidylinositol phosphodiesterase
MRVSNLKWCCFALLWSAVSWSAAHASELKPPKPAIALESASNRPGGDYRDFDLAQPEPAACAEACLRDPRCQAFSFVQPGIQAEAARCWLKDSAPDAVADDCCISGVREPGFERGINRPGSDYRDFGLYADEPALCLAACREDHECRAFSHVRAGIQANSARCWLKNAVPAPQPDACCASGVVRAADAVSPNPEPRQ